VKILLEFSTDQDDQSDIMNKVAEISKHITEMRFKLDRVEVMSEMGEMESLRLQMAMDRMSKIMSILSNILRKMEETADTITSNLK
jgi:hypothetical protein